MTKTISYGIVILAAGNSSRLGEPKQLLTYRNISLLQNAVDQSMKIQKAAVGVVTGAWKTVVEKELAGKDIHVFHNNEWETGMASSIKNGVHGLCKLFPSLNAILILVCDQPFLTYTVLNNLIHEYLNSGKGIVASSYNNTLGTPVLFSNRYFPALLDLQGQEGAKKIILQHVADSASIDFPEGGIDIDTSEDYDRLIS
ncbi:MAG: nucleotidyltransferase family protein [Flavobacterium sp.]